MSGDHPAPSVTSSIRPAHMPSQNAKQRPVSSIKTGFGPASFRAPRRRSRFGRSIAGAIASASIVGFSLLRGARDAEPIIAGVQSHASSRAEAFAMPGAAADRSAAVAETLEPPTQVVGAAASHAPLSSPHGEPDAAPPALLQRVALGGRETVPAERREAETASQPSTGQPDAIERLIEQLTKPAEAPPRDAAPAPAAPVGQSPAATPTGPAETASHLDAGRQATSVKAQTTSTDEVKATATMASGAVPAAAPVTNARRQKPCRAPFKPACRITAICQPASSGKAAATRV